MHGFFFFCFEEIYSNKVRKRNLFSNLLVSTLMITVILINVYWNYYVHFPWVLKCCLENRLVTSDKCKKKLYLQLILIKIHMRPLILPTLESPFSMSRFSVSLYPSFLWKILPPLITTNWALRPAPVIPFSFVSYHSAALKERVR